MRGTTILLRIVRPPKLRCTGKQNRTAIIIDNKTTTILDNKTNTIIDNKIDKMIDKIIDKQQLNGWIQLKIL